MKLKNNEQVLEIILRIAFYTGANKALELVVDTENEITLEKSLETEFRLFVLQLKENTHEKTGSEENRA